MKNSNRSFVTQGGRSTARSLVLALVFLTVSGFGAIVGVAGQQDIVGPAGSQSFGSKVQVLPNGNIVVVDTYYDLSGPTVSDVGAVYLYNGATLQLISQLTGSSMDDRIGFGGITVLPNGNFVVCTPTWTNPLGPTARVGAVTWCSAVTGCNGRVSVANSLIGDKAYDSVGTPFDSLASSWLVTLANSNYVVVSRTWQDPLYPGQPVGAITWGNGTGGTVGVVSPSNSLVGNIYSPLGPYPIVTLPSGNYVVRTPHWADLESGTGGLGAVTWGNGKGGTVGYINANNSLVGSSFGDNIGNTSVTVLSNGNYVVASRYWDNTATGAVDAGAVTWANGATGTVGRVTSANSLVGGSYNDQIGGVTALRNGNYVVVSMNWDCPSPSITDAGAITWASGTGPTAGMVTTANSLVGGANSNLAGSSVVALSNGNYVVRSPGWDNPSPSIADVGAVTWANGNVSTAGTIGAANSMIGSTANDAVGDQVIPLTNGNYVIGSQNWDDTANLAVNVGAVTWGDGNGGTAGTVNATNSLVGGTPNDRIPSNFGLTALPNGNYVVSSREWDNIRPLRKNAGAVTWANGLGGTVGLVTSANSLVGGRANDMVGAGPVVPLTNGNYVVTSPDCASPVTGAIYAGAVTWGNGLTGIAGTVSATNSLVGGTASDRVGSSWPRPLPNGNYVIGSPGWHYNSNAGAVGGAATWGNGIGGTVGLITAENSVIGNTQGDIGVAIAPLNNGNYMVAAPSWTAPSFQPRGAIQFGNGESGTVGYITAANSVTGAVNSDIGDSAFDYVRNRMVVGRSGSNTVTFFSIETRAIADGDFTDPANWDNGLPSSYINAVVPNGRTVTLDGAVNVGYLSIGCSAHISGASSSAYVIGNVSKDYCGAAGNEFVYPVGDAGAYLPVTATGITGTGSLLVSVTDATLTGLMPAKSVSRSWSLLSTGIVANVALTYSETDINGSEVDYGVFQRYAGALYPATNFTLDPASHTATVYGVSPYSDWGVGVSRSRSAAPLSLSGERKQAKN